jgi:hypothetical protein
MPATIDVVRGGIATRNFLKGFAMTAAATERAALETNNLPSRDHHSAKANFPRASLEMAQNLQIGAAVSSARPPR